MPCPKCDSEVQVSELLVPTRGEASRAILTDVRTWVGAFLVMACVGLVTSALGVTGATGAGGGAVIGMAIAMRMTRMRKCPKCGAIFAPPTSG